MATLGIDKAENTQGEGKLKEKLELVRTEKVKKAAGCELALERDEV